MSKKDYDVAEAFREIENELINSMIRNLGRHLDWEEKEGFNWTQWQAEQLKSLQSYKLNNKKKFNGYFSKINNKIEIALKTTYSKGNTEQERRILKALQKGYNPPRFPEYIKEFLGDNKGKSLKDITHSIVSALKSGGISKTDATFFKVNDRKLDALIKATKQDMKKAETAMLRMANDQYRKTIFNAQVYANTGAGTIEKAIDMATNDFLAKGINCIEYKDGRRVNIADYASMYIRTANKRAYLQGEGAKRQEWGISTVIVTSRGAGCPKCTPFQGRVFIDDVWSGGTSKDGNYPLISSAMKNGLYHPNCKDTHTTYFPGISEEPKAPTKEQQQQAIYEYNLQQKQKYNERVIRRYKNLEEGSLDTENKEKYKNKRKEWQQVQSNSFTDYMANRFIPKFEKESVLKMEDYSFRVKKVSNSDFDMWIDSEATAKNKAVRLYEKKLKIIRETLPKNLEMPKIAIVDFENYGQRGAIAGYNRKIDTMFINSKYDTENKILKYLNRDKGYFANTSSNSHILHELGHKYHYDIVETVARKEKLDYNKAKDMFEKPISQYIVGNSKVINDVIGREISIYALNKYKGANRMNEIMAEYFTIRHKKNDFVKFINEIIEEVMCK